MILERQDGRESERETNIDVTENIYQLPPICTLNRDLPSKLSMCPDQGLNPPSLDTIHDAPTNLATQPGLIFHIFFLRRPFNISCNTDLVVMKFFSFFLSEKLVICPLLLNNSFAGWSKLSCRALLFIILNI